MDSLSLKSALLIPGLVLTACIFSAVDVSVKGFVSSLYNGDSQGSLSRTTPHAYTRGLCLQQVETCQHFLTSLLHPSETTPNPGCGPQDSIETCRTHLLNSPCIAGLGRNSSCGSIYDSPYTAVIILEAEIDSLLNDPDTAAAVSEAFQPEWESGRRPLMSQSSKCLNANGTPKLCCYTNGC